LPVLATLFLFSKVSWVKRVRKNNELILMEYKDIIRGSYLFVTTGTILYPLAYLSLVTGALCLIAFLRSVWRRP